jgi:ABC-type amino acid transport substrate-binding protein
VEEISLHQCVDDLRAGKVTAIATAQVDLLGYTQQDGKLRIEDFHLGTEDRFAVALHKNAALQNCETIRAQLCEFSASEWRGFFSEHFPEEPTHPNKDAIEACPEK